MANKPHFCISCKIAIILLLLCLLSPAVLAEPEAVTAARQSVVHLYGMGTDSETVSGGQVPALQWALRERKPMYS